MNACEITVEELKGLAAGSYQLIDIRTSDSFAYGGIEGAVNCQIPEVREGAFDPEKPVILYCKSGIISLPLAEELSEQGLHAYSLKGGYVEWLRQKLRDQEDADFARRVEHSIQTTFHKRLFTPFVTAIKEYQLLSPGDRVAVCISGGKDSMLMAKLFQELQRHSDFPFDLTFLVMDPGYSAENREIIEHNARVLGIPVTIFESEIFDAVYSVDKNPCYLCARMRRGHLYAKAKELGCNKIALGHHYDDVIETVLMGMLYGAQIQTMMPKLKSTNFDGMELIRPLYYIREDDIKRWRDANDLGFIQCACRFTDTCTSEACQRSEKTGSKRQQVKRLIATLKEQDPQVEQNIFRSMYNVNLSTVIAYKDRDGRHHFLDTYER